MSISGHIRSTWELCGAWDFVYLFVLHCPLTQCSDPAYISEGNFVRESGCLPGCQEWPPYLKLLLMFRHGIHCPCACAHSLSHSVCTRSVTRWCPALCDPMDCIPHQAPLSMRVFRQECWGGLPFPPTFM